MDMSLSKLREMVKDREVWHAAVHQIEKRWTRLSNWTTTCPPRYLSTWGSDDFLSLTFLSENPDGDSVLLGGMLVITLGKTFSLCKTSYSFRSSLPYGNLNASSTSSLPHSHHQGSQNVTTQVPMSQVSGRVKNEGRWDAVGIPKERSDLLNLGPTSTPEDHLFFPPLFTYTTNIHWALLTSEHYDPIVSYEAGWRADFFLPFNHQSLPLLLATHFYELLGWALQAE